MHSPNKLHRSFGQELLEGESFAATSLSGGRTCQSSSSLDRRNNDSARVPGILASASLARAVNRLFANPSLDITLLWSSLFDKHERGCQRRFRSAWLLIQTSNLEQAQKDRVHRYYRLDSRPDRALAWLQKYFPPPNIDRSSYLSVASWSCWSYLVLANMLSFGRATRRASVDRV